MDDIRNILKNNLIFYAKKKGVSQKELSNQLGVTQSAVSHWFKGDNSPNIEVVNRIAQIFSVPISKLLTEPENEKTPESMETDSEEILKVLEGLLVKAGFMKTEEDISERDMKFLMGLIDILVAWFEDKR